MADLKVKPLDTPGLFAPGDLDDDGLFVVRHTPTPAGLTMSADDVVRYLGITDSDLRQGVTRGTVRTAGPDIYTRASVTAHMPGAAVCTTEQACAVLRRGEQWLRRHAHRYGVRNDPVGRASRWSREDVNRAALNLRRGDRIRARRSVRAERAAGGRP